MADEHPLTGLRILIAEDNLLVAMEIQDTVEAMGGEAVGPVAKLGQALELARGEVLHGALLDVDLRGELVFPVAEELEKRSIPVVFASGYGDDPFLSSRFAHHPRLRKPYVQKDVRELAERVFTRP